MRESGVEGGREGGGRGEGGGLVQGSMAAKSEAHIWSASFLVANSASRPRSIRATPSVDVPTSEPACVLVNDRED